MVRSRPGVVLQSLFALFLNFHEVVDDLDFGIEFFRFDLSGDIFVAHVATRDQNAVLVLLILLNLRQQTGLRGCRTQVLALPEIGRFVHLVDYDTPTINFRQSLLLGPVENAAVNVLEHVVCLEIGK